MIPEGDPYYSELTCLTMAFHAGNELVRDYLHGYIGMADPKYHRSQIVQLREVITTLQHGVDKLTNALVEYELSRLGKLEENIHRQAKG